MAQTKVSLIKDQVIDVNHLKADHGITTDHIGEGSTRQYFTTDRVQSFLTTNNYIKTTDVANLESVTSLSLNANILSYVDEAGNTTNIDLSLYLDDTNLARIVSGSLDSGTGVATFTRDDASTFTVDFSAFLSDANDYVTSASFNTTSGALTLTRLGGGTVTVDLDGKYSVIGHTHSWTEITDKPTALSAFTNDSGFLTSETDPTVPSHVKSITSTDISDWNTAYGWGNHAIAGYQAASTAITTSNIGSQSVSYAANAGTLDSLDSTEFARGRAAWQQLNFDAIKQPGLYQYDNIAAGGGTPPPDSLPFNFRTIEIGSANRYSQIALPYATDNIYFRRNEGGWGSWRTVIHDGNIGSQSVNYASSAGNADTIDGYHQDSFARLAVNSSSPTNGNFAIGSASGRNFIQSHAGQPLDINPLGNSVVVGSTLEASKLVVGGKFTIEPSGWSNADADQWPYFFWQRDTANGWDEGLIKANSTRGFFGKPGWGIHMDSSKAFHIFSTGWTANFGVEHGGNAFASGQLRAPIFYDYNNTGYYLNPDSTSVLYDLAIGDNAGSNQKIDIRYGNYNSGYGAIRFHQAGSNHNTIHSFSANWYGGAFPSASANAINITGTNGVTFGGWNNPDAWIDTSGNVTGRDSVRGPIFYDSNNTGYYLNPNGTSNLLGPLNIYDGDAAANPRISLGRGDTQRVYISVDDRVATIGHQQDEGSGEHSLEFYINSPTTSSTKVFYWKTNNGTLAYLDSAGFKSNVYYDRDNTGYYLDPASTSNFNVTQTQGCALFYSSIISCSGSLDIYNGSAYHTISAYGQSAGCAGFGYNLGGCGISYYDDYGTYVDMGSFRFLYQSFVPPMDYQGFCSQYGNLYVSGSVCANSWSDERLKCNIEPFTNALDIVEQLNGVKFEWNDESTILGIREGNKGQDYGFVAQNVQKVLPLAVKSREFEIYDEYREYYAVEIDKIVPVLVEAIKELSSELKQLKEKINGSSL